MITIDPLLNPEAQQRVLKASMQHFENSLELLFKNHFPEGHGVDEIPETDKLRELTDLMAHHDYYLSVAANPEELPWDRTRANDSLLREQELKNEVFANA